ncbi:hypothetical protein J6590_084657 [Homalodisca vitripennis]|nr:hypothetical protein J6590_084657 [Homalodisca vitripennis]
MFLRLRVQKHSFSLDTGPNFPLLVRLPYGQFDFSCGLWGCHTPTLVSINLTLYSAYSLLEGLERRLCLGGLRMLSATSQGVTEQVGNSHPPSYQQNNNN